MLKTPNLRLLLLGASCLASASAEKSAFAYYPFPGYVETHLKISTLPEAPSGQGCELCHNNPAGGLGTATQPFGVLMRAQGIVYTSSEAQVDAALDAIKADPAQTAYITDIENGVDPNTDPALAATADSSGSLTPTYGCGATIARTGVSSETEPGAFALGVTALGLVLWRRRRGRAERE